MVHVLIVVGLRQVNDLARIAQANRSERFHLTHFERNHDFVDVGERTAFALRARLRFCQIVETQHHILGGNRDRLA